MNETWIDDRIRLLMPAIDLRKETRYGQGEIPFAYQPPAEYEVAWPQPFAGHRIGFGINIYAATPNNP